MNAPAEDPPEFRPAVGAVAGALPLGLSLHPGLRAFAQVLGLAALWWASDLVMRWLHLPVPGSVAGLGILVLLLRTGLLPLAWVKEGADWLLAEMLLFFIPDVRFLTPPP